MNERPDLARAFLADCFYAGLEPVFLAGDASARRYFRLHHPSGQTAVLMDAPPDGTDSMRQFLKIGAFLNKAGFSAPQVLKQSLDQGFLLLEDFGSDLVAKLVIEQPSLEPKLYQSATDVLVALENTAPPTSVPIYTAEIMADMISPAYDWYRWAALGEVKDPNSARDLLGEALKPLEGEVMALRDYHAENLIWLPGRPHLRNIGLLDFQDAFVGPAGYDLVSLLQDARRDVTQGTAAQIKRHFANETGRTLADVEARLAILGLQRNLRILGVFARLALKFDKPRYLDFLPRVWRYVQTSFSHPALSSLGEQINHDLPAPTPALISDLRKRCGTAQTR